MTRSTDDGTDPLTVQRACVVPKLRELPGVAVFGIAGNRVATARVVVVSGAARHLPGNLVVSPLGVVHPPEGDLIYTNHGEFAAKGGGQANVPPWMVGSLALG